MSNKEMTVQQYANLRKITPGAVRKAIYYNHHLPGVISWVKFGRDYKLIVNEAAVRNFEKSL